MATDRSRVRRSHGLRFAKLLGTGSGETFSLRDADPHHWGLIAVWDDVADARVFELGSLVTTWDHHCYEKLDLSSQQFIAAGVGPGANRSDPVQNRQSRGQ